MAVSSANTAVIVSFWVGRIYKRGPRTFPLKTPTVMFYRGDCIAIVDLVVPIL